MKKPIAKIYLSTLFQMLIFTVIASPLATLILYACSYPVMPALQDFGEVFTLLKTAGLMVPLTSMPFLIFFASPYAVALKNNNNKRLSAWILGLGFMAFIYPIAMHSIKFLILGVFEIHTVETAYFGIFVAMYARYGADTLTAILVAIAAYLLFLRTKANPSASPP